MQSSLVASKVWNKVTGPNWAHQEFPTIDK